MKISIEKLYKKIKKALFLAGSSFVFLTATTFPAYAKNEINNASARYENGKVIVEGKWKTDYSAYRRDWNHMLCLNEFNGYGSTDLLDMSSFDACEQYGVSYDNGVRSKTVTTGISKTENDITLEFGKGNTLNLSSNRNYDAIVYFPKNTEFNVKVTIGRNTPFNYTRFIGLSLGSPYNVSSNATAEFFGQNDTTVSEMVKHIKECNGGNWQSDANQHWKICGTCGYTAVGRTNHNWETTKEATCTATGTKRCRDCGRTENIPAKGHNWSSSWTSDGSNHWHKCTRCSAINGKAAHNWTTTKAATCTADGSKKCSTCGSTATISKLGHNWSTAWTSDNSKHWHKCTRCSATKDSASHTWTYSNINAQTHDKKCNICGKTITKEAHNFVNNKCACGRYNTVKVSFDLNKPAESKLADPNPSSINQITYTYGDKYYDSKYGLVNPTLQDYTFEGWYTAKTGGTKVDTGTAVSNSNAHTLYAHWKEANLPITSIKLNNKQVIEYLKDTTESQYRSKYKPDANIPYANVDISANITKPSGKYVYTWECYKDGKWQSVNLSGITVTDTALNIKNATRSLNGLKFRLSVKGNNSKVVTSNEATLTVWWLPNASEQIYTIIGD